MDPLLALTRRGLLLGSTAALLSAPVLAQQSARRPRVAFLGVATREAHENSAAAFARQLSDLGYVDGKTIDIDWRYGDGFDERLPGIAADIVKAAPNVIVATGDSPGIVRAATTTIPIVATNIPESSATALVGNLARPSGNVTGIMGLGAGSLIGKQIEVLAEAVGNVRSIGLMDYVGGTDGGASVRNAAAKAAAALNLEMKAARYTETTEVEGAFRDLAAAKVNAVLAPGNTAFAAARDKVIALGVSERMPVLYNNPQIVVLGGLISYSNDQRVMTVRSAVYVDRILKGARPGGLPMEIATPWLAINRKAAKSIGLDIPVSLVVRANEVID